MITSSSAPRRLGLPSRPPGRTLPRVPRADGCPLRAGPAGDHALGSGPVHLHGGPRDRQVGDPVVEGGSRWRVLWVHHEAEELRVHYRGTIPRETARHVALDLLASGRVPPMQEDPVADPQPVPIIIY